MALGPRLDLRQSQQLVMTPQLQQAIKPLAASNLEIESFIGDALEANPLLEAGAVSREDTGPVSEPDDVPREEFTSDQLMAQAQGESEAPLDIDTGALDRDRDTGLDQLRDRLRRRGHARLAVEGLLWNEDTGHGVGPLAHSET